MKFNYFIGIDVSKCTLDVVLLDSQGKYIGSKTITNDTKGFRIMLRWIYKVARHSKGHNIFCLEHTGIYSFPICCFLEEQSISYSLQPGLEIKRSMGIQRGKNDQTDARIIAQYAYLHRNDIQIYQLPSKFLLKIKQLLSYRGRLVKSKVAFQVAAKELSCFTDEALHLMIINDSQDYVSQLQNSIKEIDMQIKNIILATPQLSKLYELATSVKGIGLQITANLLVYTHGFTKFKDWRKFSCYCGLAPFEYRSGSSVRGKTKVSYFGNKKLKAIIGNGVSSAIQHDKELANYYHRKLNEGKHKMLVKNAIKNKLLSRVFAVVKRGTPFVPLHQFAT